MKRFIALTGILVLTFTFLGSKETTYTPLNGSGISFKKLSFEEAKAEAKKSGKLLFVDAYAEWCGPCKRMKATTFKDPKVGTFFSEHFISIRIEMDRDKEGPGLAKTYGVNAYPTLLILNTDGTLIEKTIGMKSRDQLLTWAKTAL